MARSPSFVYGEVKKPFMAAGLLLRPFSGKYPSPGPVTVRVEGFGQKYPGANWAYSGGRRGASRWRDGHAQGGIVFLPPDRDMFQLDTAFAGADTAPLVAVAGGAKWAAGIPHEATGTIKTGYDWEANSVGDLIFRSRDNSAAPTTAVRFAQDGDIAFRSSTAYWGEFAHGNTADRVWTFPDADGTVALVGSGVTLDPHRVVVTDDAGALADDDNLRWTASGVTLDIGTGSGATGLLRLWSAGSAFFTALLAGDATADTTYTLPLAYPASSLPLLVGATGAMSYGQGILTTSTPQFARLGLGAAADATIPLYISGGFIGLGSATNPNMTNGLYINQPSMSNEVLAFGDTDQINHGMTTRALTSVFCSMRKYSNTAGGAVWFGLAEGGTPALVFYGMNVNDNATKTTSGLAPVMFSAQKKGGTTSGACGATANLVCFQDYGSSVVIIEKEGRLHINETSTDTFPTIDMKQSSTGDVGIRVGLGSTMSAMIGLDNSSTGDRLAVAFAASATAVLGTGDVFALWSTGNCQSGPDGAGATGDTTGYWYVRECAGTPTGVPTTITGYKAMRWDTTNKKLYVYDGSWLAMN